MKLPLLSLLFVVAFSRFNPDDLTKLMSGFIEGIGLATIKEKLLPCANEIVWQAWEETIPATRLALTGNRDRTFDGLHIFFRAPYETLTFLRPCATTEINKLNDMINTKVHNDAAFANHVAMKTGDIFAQFQDFLESWDKNKYIEAGLKAARLFLLAADY